MLSRKSFLISLLLTCLLFVLFSTFFLNQIKHHAETRIENWLNSKISDKIIYREILITPFGDIKIQDISCTDKQSQNDILMHISSLKMNVKLLSLIKNHIEFSNLIIDGMSLKISRNPENQWNGDLIKNFLQSIADSSINPLKVERFNILNSHLTIGDSKLDININCQNLNFYVNNQPQKHIIRGRCAIRKTKIQIAHKMHFLNKVHSTFYITDHVVNISSHATYFERSPVQIKMQLNTSNQFDFNGEFLAKPDLFEIAQVSGIPHSIVQGMPAVSCSFSGHLKNFYLNTKIDVNQMSFYNLTIDSVHANAEFDAKKCLLSNVEVQLLKGTLYSTGLFNYNDTTKNAVFTFRFRDAAFNQALQLFQIKSNIMDGQLNGKGHFSFRLSDMELNSFKGDMLLSNTTYKKRPVPDSQLKMILKNNYLEASLTMKSAAAHFNGTLVNNVWQNATLLCDVPNVTIFRTAQEQNDISGQFKMMARVKGGLTTPGIDGHFSINDFIYRGVLIDSMSGIFLGNQHHITIERSYFCGKINDFEKVTSFYNFPQMRGTLNYEGALTGAIQNPKISITAYWDSCGIGKYGVDHLKLTLTYNNKIISRITVIAVNNNTPFYIDFQTTPENPHFVKCIMSPDSLNLKDNKHPDQLSQGNYILVTGNYKSSKSGDLNAVIDRLRLDDISKFYRGDDKMCGLLNAEGEIHQLPGNPNIFLKMRIDNFHSPFLQLQEIVSSVSYRNKTIEIEKMIWSHENKTAIITGTIPLDSNNSHQMKQLDLSLTTTDFPLNCFSKYQQFYTAERAGAKMDVNLSGNLEHTQIHGAVHLNLKKAQNKYSKRKLQSANIILHINGLLNQPDFSVDWQSTDLNWEGFYASSFNGSLSYADSLIHLTDVSLDLLQNRSQLNGTIPVVISLVPLQFMVAKKPITIKSNADKLNLAFFTPVFPALEHITGNLNYDFEISGTFEEPIVFGRVDIDNTEIKFKNISPPIKNLAAAIRFTGLQPTIDTCHARIGEGFLTIRGSSAIQHSDNIRTWNYDAHFINVPLYYENVFKAQIDTCSLFCRGITSDLKIDGFIDIKGCKIIKDIPPRKLVDLNTNLNLCNLSDAGVESSVKTEIKLNFKNYIQWDNRYLNITMKPHLKIVGNLCQPRLNGSVQLIEGSFRYLNRQFLISRGYLKFIEKNENNPVFDIQSNTLVRSYENIGQKNYLITLSLAGDIENTDYELICSPNLSQPDIIAMLTKGKTRKPVKKEKITGELSYSDILVERARSLTSQSVESIAEKQVGTLFNLDKVDVKLNYSDKNARKGTRIIASKKIAGELDITYTSVVGYSNDQAIKLEYKISDTISLEGESDQKGRTGIDLKFKYNFK